jgi:lipoate-protein ligase A
MTVRWRLILQKDISSAYAMALDDAFHRVAAKEQSGVLHLYNTVPALLVGRWHRGEIKVSNELDVNRRPTGGLAVTSGENFLSFSLSLPSTFTDDYSLAFEKLSAVIKSLAKGRVYADGSIRDSNTIKGVLSICSECEGAILLQGGFFIRAAGIKSLAIAQRLLKEEIEKRLSVHFVIDTISQQEKEVLNALLHSRYLQDEWRAFGDVPKVYAKIKKDYADFCVAAGSSGGVISNLKVWGTFIGDADAISKSLAGLKPTKKDLSKALTQIPTRKKPYKFKDNKILEVIQTALHTK